MISIVIPSSNEANQLPATLAAIKANQCGRESRGASPEIEVIVVDAGSIDETAKLAATNGAHVLVSPRSQRAAQMNLGARQARGDVLLFLHADTLLPVTALGNVEGALADPGVVGGGFARRFAARSLFLRVTCLLAEWRGRALGWFLGDQGIFARRATFESLGGYPEIDVFEDLAFSRRLTQAGRVVTLRPPVVSSARRFVESGAFVTTCRDAWFTCRYLNGTDPRDLAVRHRARATPAPHRRPTPRPGRASGV
ncbi:MAG: TIGR04283 family arsenosugar biosynthesis glycosyltransferase [Limisphaerales bacterium]